MWFSWENHLSSLCLSLLSCKMGMIVVSTFESSYRSKELRTIGSHSLLQGIFTTQESNQGLLHCRQVLYQLSYQGSPAESYDSSTPRFLKIFHIVFDSSFSNLHSHEKCFLFSPTLAIDSSQVIVILTVHILLENVC